jgi:hypothetical protein
VQADCTAKYCVADCPVPVKVPVGLVRWLRARKQLGQFRVWLLLWHWDAHIGSPGLQLRADAAKYLRCFLPKSSMYRKQKSGEGLLWEFSGDYIVLTGIKTLIDRLGLDMTTSLQVLIPQKSLTGRNWRSHLYQAELRYLSPRGRSITRGTISKRKGISQPQKYRHERVTGVHTIQHWTIESRLCFKHHHTDDHTTHQLGNGYLVNLDTRRNGQLKQRNRGGRNSYESSLVVPKFCETSNSFIRLRRKYQTVYFKYREQADRVIWSQSDSPIFEYPLSPKGASGGPGVSPGAARVGRKRKKREKSTPILILENALERKWERLENPVRNQQVDWRGMQERVERDRRYQIWRLRLNRDKKYEDLAFLDAMKNLTVTGPEPTPPGDYFR